MPKEPPLALVVGVPALCFREAGTYPAMDEALARVARATARLQRTLQPTAGMRAELSHAEAMVAALKAAPPVAASDRAACDTPSVVEQPHCGHARRESLFCQRKPRRMSAGPALWKLSEPSAGAEPADWLFM